MLPWNHHQTAVYICPFKTNDGKTKTIFSLKVIIKVAFPWKKCYSMVIILTWIMPPPPNPLWLPLSVTFPHPPYRYGLASWVFIKFLAFNLVHIDFLMLAFLYSFWDISLEKWNKVWRAGEKTENCLSPKAYKSELLLEWANKLCAIWYHLYNLKHVKNTHGEVLLFIKL